MSAIDNIYETTEQYSETDIKYFFISKGAKDVVKVIQYAFVQEFNGKRIFNLGFGDYDIENDKIIDDVNTNNGDTYKVFNTVLNTIPGFFEKFNNEVLLVQGSDGRPEYLEKCKNTCRKNCQNYCRNYNRRINIYSGYIEKNYDELVKNYRFLGGQSFNGNQILMEIYQRKKNYDSVLLFRKNLNFTI